METIGQDGRRGSRGLSVIAASLDAISKNSEPSFMKIGMALQSIYADASDLSLQTLETAAQSSEAVTGLSSHTETVRELTDYHGQLEEIGRGLNLDTGQIELTHDEIEKIRKTYTMQEERSIHEQFIDLKGVSTSAGKGNADADNLCKKDVSLEICTSYINQESIQGDSLGNDMELF